MTNELEKTFFDTFGIECNISFHQQFNGAQVPRGLEFYKKREELAKTGIIKIWHKMLNPRPENDCVYWGEYHYPQITDRILMELICILSEWRTYLHSSYTIKANNTLNLKQDVLKDFLKLFKWYEFKKCEKDINHQVRTVFEEG